jgi:SAM-dependent methyltransferase
VKKPHHPRHEFVPGQLRELAYADGALGIGHGQTISQPYVVAVMTELLRLKPSDRVLEIGTGSGYQAAVLAEIVAEVYTIEIIEPLANSAAERLKRLGYGTVQVKCGDARRVEAEVDRLRVECHVNRRVLVRHRFAPDGWRHDRDPAAKRFEVQKQSLDQQRLVGWTYFRQQCDASDFLIGQPEIGQPHLDFDERVPRGAVWHDAGRFGRWDRRARIERQGLVVGEVGVDVNFERVVGGQEPFQQSRHLIHGVGRHRIVTMS